MMIYAGLTSVDFVCRAHVAGKSFPFIFIVKIHTKCMKLAIAYTTLHIKFKKNSEVDTLSLSKPWGNELLERNDGKGCKRERGGK